MAQRRVLELTPKTLAVALAVIAVAAVVAHRMFFAPSETQRIERVLTGAAEAAEAESIIRLSDVFTFDYHDASGADRSVVLGHAQRFFGEADNIRAEIVRVLHQDPKLPRDATEARAIVIVRLSGIEKTGGEKFSGIAGPGGDAFDVRFRRGNGAWKVAQSRRLSGTNPQELMRELRGGAE
jgi:hypothetical protein